MKGGIKNWRNSANISHHFENETRYGHEELVYDLSNGAISSDFQWPLTQVSRSRQHSTLNMSLTVQERHIII